MSGPRKDLRDELSASEGEPSSPYACVDPDEIPGEGGRVVRRADFWTTRLVVGERKGPHGEYSAFTQPISANVATILRFHSQWSGAVAYDEFRETIVSTREPPWDNIDAPPIVEPGVWADEDSDRLRTWLARDQKLIVPQGEVEQGLRIAAHTNRVHPVCEYLRSLSWDGTPRIDSWLHTYLGTPDTLYERGVGSKWLISAIARVVEPGCQADCTLILEGAQGLGKTRAFRTLVPVDDWFASTGLDLGNKDSLDALRAVWIYGLDELDSLRRGEVTRWKSFLTQNRDHYRPPYARRARDFARQNVFCGTTNESEYLSDRTGNRRFWPVKAGTTGEIDYLAIRRDRDQLWAEAFARQVAGEEWHINKDSGLRLLAEQQQDERVQEHPWEEPIRVWLERPLVTGSDGHPELADLRGGVLTTDALTYAISMRRSDQTQTHLATVATILRGLGYERGPQCRGDSGKRERRYVRPADPA